MSLLLTNARVFRSAHDPDPAGAILIRQSTVAWLGELSDAPPADEWIDLGGRVVLPGLTDPHLHIFMLALSRLQVSFALTPATSIADVIQRLAEGHDASGPGDWLQGCDLMEDRLAEGRLPDAADLDRAFPENPVLLRRYCGHVAMLNTAAMQALGLAPDVADPPAGVFHRDADGTLTGIAEETAAEWIFTRAPCPPDEAIAARIASVLTDCLAMGLTALTEAAVGFSIGYDREMAVWEHLRATRPVPLRLGFMLQLDPAEAAQRGLRPDPNRAWSIETLKFFADGIIGGRSGAVSVPYDDTGGTGVLMQPPGVLEDAFHRTHADGWRIAVHATGDRAIARVRDAMIAAQGTDTSRRHRIEHCFVPPNGLFDQLAAAGISTVMQPSFVSRMGASIGKGLGARTATAYPAASPLAAGAALAFSSDAPTGLISPWEGIRAAVTRRGAHGGLIGPDEAVDFRTALDAYIAGGSRVMRQEDFRGTLAPGMAADLVVLEADPFVRDPDTLGETRAYLTMTDGAIVHRADG